MPIQVMIFSTINYKRAGSSKYEKNGTEKHSAHLKERLRG